MVTDLEFRQLKYFVQVAYDQNYTTAAKKLFISQPTLSWTIKNLEKDLGTKLFHYDGKKLCLTHSGAVLLKYAEELLDEQMKVIEVIQNSNNIIRGNLNIGLPELFASCFYMKAIMRFMKLYPEIKITMVNDGSLAVQKLVDSEQLDVGFISNILVDDHLEVIDLHDSYPIVLVMNKHHPLSKKKSISFADLKNESFINFSEENYTLGKLTIQKCTDAGFSPKIVLESSEWDILLEVVANSSNVSIQPYPIVKRFQRNDLTFIPFNESESTVPVGLVTKKNSHKSSPLQRFIQFMLDDIVNNPRHVS